MLSNKIAVHIDREIAARPELIQIENGWRNAREQRPGAVQRGHFREIETVVENPDAEPALPCAAAKPAIIVYGKRVGTTLTVCMDNYSRSINRADSFAGSDDRHSTAQNRESGKPRPAPPGERERPRTY